MAKFLSALNISNEYFFLYILPNTSSTLKDEILSATPLYSMMFRVILFLVLVVFLFHDYLFT